MHTHTNHTRIKPRTHARTLVQEFTHIYHAAKLLLRHAARINARDAALRHPFSLDQRFDFQKNKKGCGRGNHEIDRAPQGDERRWPGDGLHRLPKDGVSLIRSYGAVLAREEWHEPPRL